MHDLTVAMQHTGLDWEQQGIMRLLAGLDLGHDGTVCGFKLVVPLFSGGCVKCPAAGAGHGSQCLRQSGCHRLHVLASGASGVRLMGASSTTQQQGMTCMRKADCRFG